MGFELFERGSGWRGSAEPLITVSKNGYISVNRSVREKYFKDAEAVQLLYDREGKRIGLRPVGKEVEHAYAFRHGKGRGGGLVFARSFLKYYGIEHEKAGFVRAGQ